MTKSGEDNFLDTCSVSSSVSPQSGDLIAKGSEGGTNGVVPFSLAEEALCTTSGFVNELRGIFFIVVFFLGGPWGEVNFHFCLKWTSKLLHLLPFWSLYQPP